MTRPTPKALAGTVERQRGEQGAVLAEYALLLSLILAVCFAAIGLVGGALRTLFELFVYN